MTYGDIGVAGRGGILQFSSKLRMADLLGLASLLPPQGEETRLRFEIGDCDNMDPINAHVEIRERAIQGDRFAICRCVKKTRRLRSPPNDPPRDHRNRLDRSRR